jgi:hypothetical protein
MCADIDAVPPDELYETTGSLTAKPADDCGRKRTITDGRHS